MQRFKRGSNIKKSRNELRKDKRQEKIPQKTQEETRKNKKKSKKMINGNTFERINNKQLRHQKMIKEKKTDNQ